MNLIVFGYAGSSDNTFRNLASELPAEVSMRQFVYPGRGSRFKRHFASSLVELAQEAGDSISSKQPFILMGFSFGALVAYEAARYLQRQGQAPMALVVCAMNAPQSGDYRNQVHQLDMATLASYLNKLGGTPGELLESPEFLAWYAPIIQSDYRLMDAYRHDPNPVLESPILALTGESDPLTTRDAVGNWSSCTSSTFHSVSIPGSHFFLDESPHILAAELINGLSEVAQEREGSINGFQSSHARAQ
ncbi:hypothetical protein BTA51_26055 [Hahella sp. CCB-MM4]|uniref:thioesterase II family protein n=1 Tax=Hahella sp. (strain CCB-MM4) TaxID=1926491 RepID=UPI000B9B6340|nr:alpha/beta fold hydrolase [Hahella sp. CCB-MM4]OZG70435.1 hypothetical protein BTA51_26055 [Hahella sp. CCB-MM4]